MAATDEMDNVRKITGREWGKRKTIRGEGKRRKGKV